MPVIGVTRHASEAEVAAEADEIWQRDWVEALTRNGDIDLELVKRELAAYSNLQRIVEIVWCDATGGRMSKSGYNDTSQILDCIQENFDEEWRDNVADALQAALPETWDSPQAKEQMRDYLADVCEALEIVPAKPIMGDES